MITLRESLLRAKQDPNGEHAKRMFEFIKSGAADERARIEGIDLTSFGRPSFVKTDSEELEAGYERARTLRLEASKGKGVEFLKQIAPVGGMVAGGLAGLPLVPALGPGAPIVTAGLGGAGGKALQQALEGEDLEAEEILRTGIESMFAEAAAGGVLKLGAAGLKAAKPTIEAVLKVAQKPAKALGRIGVAFWKSASRVFGISDEAINTIKKFPAEVEAELEAIKKAGGPTVTPLVKRLQSARNKYSTQIGEEYEKGWNKLLKSGEKYSYDRTKTIKSINEFLEAEKTKGNTFFEIKNGKLDFSNSPFTQSQQQNVIQKIANEIDSASPKNIAEIRSLKQKINNIYKEYSSQFGKNAQLNRVVTNMVKSVDEALPQKLRDLSKAYSEGITFLDRVDELLLPEGASGELKAGVISKTKAIGRQEIEELYAPFIQDFKKRTGVDLTKELDIFRTSAEISPLSIRPEGDISGPIRIIQKVWNPISGRARLEAAKGNFSLATDTFDIIKKSSSVAWSFVKPFADLLKSQAIPVSIKTTVFLELDKMLSGEQPKEPDEDESGQLEL